MTRRGTRKHYSAEEKIRIVLDGLWGASSIAELCRREGTPRGYITAGRRSCWKPASGGWRATRRGLKRTAGREHECVLDPFEGGSYSASS